MSGSRLDQLLPRFDAVERHQIALPHSAAEVWSALESFNFAGPLGVRLMMGLRAIPGLLLDPARIRELRRPLRLADLEPLGFGRLAEAPGRALVLGVEGRFWRPAGNVEPFERERFLSPVAAGRARALWSFEIFDAHDPDDPAERPPAGGAEAGAEGGARLVTETRIACGDPASRRKFRIYWFFVRPGSGLIRRWILTAIRRDCRLRAAAA